MYEPEVTRRAMTRYRAMKDSRERKRYLLEQKLYREHPQLRQLDGQISGAMADLADLALSGKKLDPKGPEIAEIRKRSETLQQERLHLLKELHVNPEDLDNRPACPICGDTGWSGGEMCSCLKSLCQEEQLKSLTALLGLTEEQSFDRFRMDVYSDVPWKGEARSPRENMSRVLRVCQRFADEFPNCPVKNLFFSGGTGLGKTFLSGCIAREVSQRGFSVVYDSAINTFNAFETVKFTRDIDEGRSARDITRRYLGCDLLILDDLGSELTTSLVQASLYQIVNTRLMQDQRTILSTNLSKDQISLRYGPQLGSRIGGLYQDVPFYGGDIRNSGKL